MPGYFVKTVHKGNKVYHINYGRIVMSVVLLLAVIVFGVCMLISGIRKNKANEQLASRFTLLSMSSVPKASEQTKQRCVVLDPGHGGTDPGSGGQLLYRGLRPNAEDHGEGGTDRLFRGGRAAGAVLG